MRLEYDFSGGIRGKYAGRQVSDALPILLAGEEPDPVADAVVGVEPPFHHRGRVGSARFRAAIFWNDATATARVSWPTSGPDRCSAKSSA